MRERVGKKRLADAHRPDDRDVRVRLEEAERDEFVPQRAVVGDFRSLVPALKLHLRVEVAALGAHGSGAAVAAADLVGEHEQEQVLVGHLLLPSDGEPLRQRVEYRRELEAPERGLEVSGDQVGGHGSSPSGLSRSREACGRAYCEVGRR